MNVKRLAITVFAAIFVVITAISFLAYDKSASIDIVCEKGSYAEEYAKKHNIEYEIIADSEKDSIKTDEKDFSYNNDGTIVSYKGLGKHIVIPEKIDEITITAIAIDPADTNATSIYIPATVNSIVNDLYLPRYDATFFIGWFMSVVGFVMAVIAVLKADIDTKKKTFLRLSVFTTAYGVSIASAVLAALYMFILPISFEVPVWLGALFIILIVAFGVTAFMKINTAVELVEEVEKKVKQKTFFIKSLTVDADTLVAQVENAEIKTFCKNVYEAVRYSDPMSSEALASSELDIENKFAAFSEAALSGDVELAQTTSKALLVSIEARNKKCKLLK